MRVTLTNPSVPVAPGGTATFEIEVRNDSEVIEGVTARVIGVDPGWVRTEPDQLALFPDSDGVLQLSVDLPKELPAGPLELTIEVVSSVDPGVVEHLEATIDIQPVSSTRLLLEPMSLDGYRDAAGTVSVENLGNSTIDVALTGVDPERVLGFTFHPPVLSAPPGERVTADYVLRAPRRVIGSPLMRPFSIHGGAEDSDLQANGTFSQRAMIPRGVATAGVLAGIIALWAIVAVLAIGFTLRGEDLAKQASPEFFAPSFIASGTGGEDGDDTKGLDVRVVGSDLAGEVVAETDGRGIPRITVDAFRVTRSGPRLVAAAATDDDGAFTIPALLPGSYLLRFSADGFDPTWYPDATDASTAEAVPVNAVDEREPLEVALAGQEGSLTGRIDLGGAADVDAVVTVRQVVGGAAGEAVRVVGAAADGTYTVAPLDTPASYEVSVTASGFEEQITTYDLRGGEDAVLNTIRMTSGDGTITGVVSSGGLPLGGVTVTALSGNDEYLTATPTTGDIGRYTLENLPTPATYLLTFERPGFGIETAAVQLGPGATEVFDVSLTGGTGTLEGRVVRAGTNDGLGDVIVTVSGEGTTVSAATLTSGDVGRWRVTGLPTPGAYTVSFELDGFRTETRAAVLDSSAQAPSIDVALTRTLGGITGTVSGPGGALGGAEVEIADGATVRLVQSADNPRGRYRIDDLPPGAYSVTVRAAGHAARTEFVEVRPGRTEQVDVRLGRSG